MISKKQAAFGQQVDRALALQNVKQRQVAAYLGIASSSVSRKLHGKHPWTADEQDKLKRWLHLHDLPDASPPCRDDPALEAMTQVILGLTRHRRPEIYKLVVSVTRGLQDELTPSGQEAYRAFCALVG